MVPRPGCLSSYNFVPLFNPLTLQPGDIITTGTPPGVGMGMTPQRFLKPGDVMELGVEGLGSQRQKTVQA